MTQCGLKGPERAEILLSAGEGMKGLSTTAASHLLSCASCSEEFAKQAALWNCLDCWTVPEVSSGFNRELYAKIDAAIAEPWYDRFSNQMRAMFAQPSLAIAAAALVIGLGFMLDHPASRLQPRQPAQMSNVHPASAQVSASEAEQVEKTLDDIEMLRQFDLNVEEKETTSKSM